MRRVVRVSGSSEPPDNSSFSSPMSFKRSLFAGMVSVPIAFSGMVGSVFADTIPPALVAPDQVATQKAIVEQALSAVKIAHAKLMADLKVEPALDPALIKADHEALRTAMKTFHQEMIKLPKTERDAFHDRIKTLIKGSLKQGKGMHRSMKRVGRNERRDERRSERREERQNRFEQFRERLQEQKAQ